MYKAYKKRRKKRRDTGDDETTQGRRRGGGADAQGETREEAGRCGDQQEDVA